MQYGFILPGGDIHTIIELASEAEAVGWDGVFYWDAICIESAGLMYDPWLTLTAIAMHTKSV
jgi:alkanesulfonate monooxygenase SsuD/methylene tetrahydromethanopterin reductase-like flavin-dependent oxidoreductase (luciferase family)